MSAVPPLKMGRSLSAVNVIVRIELSLRLSESCPSFTMIVTALRVRLLPASRDATRGYVRLPQDRCAERLRVGPDDDLLATAGASS